MTDRLGLSFVLACDTAGICGSSTAHDPLLLDYFAVPPITHRLTGPNHALRHMTL